MGYEVELFDKIGNMASETYKYTTEKTSKIAKEAKIKMKINQYKSDISDIYEQIGELIYQKHIREEDINIEEDIEEYCKKIDDLSNKIEKIRMEMLSLKDKKQCSKCYKEIEIEDKYCPNCGEKQEAPAAKEVEIIEKEPDEEQTEMVDENEHEEN